MTAGIFRPVRNKRVKQADFACECKPLPSCAKWRAANCSALEPRLRSRGSSGNLALAARCGPSNLPKKTQAKGDSHESLAGKIALVTGASKGICGAVIAEQMAAEGRSRLCQLLPAASRPPRRLSIASRGRAGRPWPCRPTRPSPEDIQRLVAVGEGKALRPARHPRQQRGDLRFVAAGRRDRGAFSQAFQSQCAGADPDHPRSAALTFRPGGRQHCQHQFRRQHAGDSRLLLWSMAR